MVEKNIIMIRTLFLVFLTSSINSAFSKKAEITLGKISLMNNQVEIKIPTHFSALLDHETKKYYSEDKLPKVAYADSLREVRLAFYMQKNENKDLGAGAIKANVITSFMEADLKMKELSNGMTTVDGSDMAYVGILHKSPEKFYRFYFLTVYKGLVLAGELISPKKGYKTWIPIGEEIMNSLDVK